MEDIRVNDSRLFSIVVLFDMHTTFFGSVIEGISAEDAQKRLNTKANHVSWLAGSLVQQRYELANTFGIDEKQSANDLFKDNLGIQDQLTYPSLESYHNDWLSITPRLRKALTSADAHRLNIQFEMMPGMMMSIFDLVTFVTYREANHIGQMALWRRLLGYDAMKYM
jgi:hypothetical protein